MVLFGAFREKIELKSIGKKRLQKIRQIDASNISTKKKIERIKALRLSKYTQDRLVGHYIREEYKKIAQREFDNEGLR